MNLEFMFESYVYFGLFLVFRKSKQDLTENLMRICNHFDPRPIHKNSKYVIKNISLYYLRATVITWPSNRKILSLHDE